VNNFLKKYNYLFYLFFLLIFTSINISNSDFTSNIDFDLIVIFNSIQIYSGQFQDYRDHPGYTQFLIFGFFYKILSVFSFFEIDIYNFGNSSNLYNKINYIYFLFKYINCLAIFFFIIFFNKVLKFFFVDRTTAFVLSFCILLSSSAFYSIMMLRADIFSYLFFLISFYFFLSFIKKPKIFKLIIISFSTILALLSKIQIIIFYFTLLFLIPFFLKYEALNLKQINEIIKKKIPSLLNVKKILGSLIFLFLILHITLNNLPNSRFAERKYLDLIIFFSIFFINFVYLRLFFKNYIATLSKIYLLILIFIFLVLVFLNFISFIGLIKLSPYILLRISNPFYYLSVYGSDHNFSIYTEIVKIINNFTFKINYYVFATILISTILSFIYEKNHKYKLYSLLFLICSLSINFIYNFRYQETYGISLLLYLFLSLYFSLNYINIKFKYITLLLFFIFFISEYRHISNKLFLQKSNMIQVCLDNEIKNFYWWWARGLDNNFFRKICEENTLTYNKFIKKIN